MHCLEELTSNVEIIEWYMLNFSIKQKKTQQTGNNDVSQEA